MQVFDNNSCYIWVGHFRMTTVVREIRAVSETRKNSLSTVKLARNKPVIPLQAFAVFGKARNFRTQSTTSRPGQGSNQRIAVGRHGSPEKAGEGLRHQGRFFRNPEE